MTNNENHMKLWKINVIKNVPFLISGMFQKLASLKYHKNSVSISNLLNVYHIPKATHDSWQINWPQKKRKCEWLHYYCLVHLFGKRMKKKKVLDDKGICCFFFVQTWEFCRSSKPLEVVVDIQCAGNKKVVTFQFHIMTKVRTNKEF